MITNTRARLTPGPVLAFGLLVGASFIITTLLFLTSERGIAVNPRLNNVLACLAIIGIFFGVKRLRDERLEGTITYGRAFVAGLQIACVAAAIHAVHTYIIYATHPALVEGYQEALDEISRELYKDESFATLLRETTRRLIGPVFIAFEEGFAKVISGTAFSIVIGAILRRRVVPNQSIG
jgi:hypothetical protein